MVEASPNGHPGVYLKAKVGWAPNREEEEKVLEGKSSKVQKFKSLRSPDEFGNGSRWGAEGTKREKRAKVRLVFLNNFVVGWCGVLLLFAGRSLRIMSPLNSRPTAPDPS
jgi:hypothetical protein